MSKVSSMFNVVKAAWEGARRALAQRLGFKPEHKPMWRQESRRRMRMSELEDRPRCTPTRGAFGRGRDGLSRRWSRQAKRHLWLQRKGWA